jgi:hypothetical protein
MIVINAAICVKSHIVSMRNSVSEEVITSIFRVGNQPSMK